MTWSRNLKSLPKLKSVMTPFPHSIELHEPLSRAEEMMVSHEIRHLPVIRNGKLVGFLAARDIKRAREKNPSVEELTHRETYVVDLSAPLDRVLLHMAKEHIEVALVVKEDRLAGIFTLTDACKQFAECLQAFFPSGGSDEAA